MANLFTSNDALERTKTQLIEIFEKSGKDGHLSFFFPGGKPMPGANLRYYTSFGWDRNSDIYSTQLHRAQSGCRQGCLSRLPECHPGLLP